MEDRIYSLEYKIDYMDGMIDTLVDEVRELRYLIEQIKREMNDIQSKETDNC